MTNSQYVFLTEMNNYYQQLQIQNSLMMNNLISMVNLLPVMNKTQQEKINQEDKIQPDNQQIPKLKMQEISQKITKYEISSQEEKNLIQPVIKNLEQKPFTCDFPGCNKKFTANYNKKIHYRSHTNERPYKCSKCNRQYYDRANYKYHLRTAHQNLAESEIKCFHCNGDQLFKTKKQKLSHHMKLNPECVGENYKLIDLMKIFKDTTKHLITKFNLNQEEVHKMDDYQKLSEEIINLKLGIFDKEKFDALFGSGFDI